MDASNSPGEPERSPLSRKMLIRLGIWLSLGVAIPWAAFVWWCASEIAEPGRRPVSITQTALMGDSEKAGFSVETMISTNGMPCLVCTPLPIHTLSERAAVIRKQLEDDGMTLRPAGEIIGTLLLLHGRSGMKEDYLRVAERYCAIGFRCVIPDLPGHGSHPDRFATYGVREAEMLLGTYLEAASEFGFPVEPCAVLGQSMGGSVAIHAAALPDSPFQSMIVVASFDRLDTVIRGQSENLFGSFFGHAVRVPAERVFGWRTGIRISEINPVEKAKAIRIPTMVVHGDSDGSVPTAAGKKLYAAFSDEIAKQWLTVPGAGHDDVLVTDYPLYAAMGKWLLQHLNQVPTASPASAPR